MAEVTIEQFYPMHIGYALNPFHDDIKKDLTKYCFDLQSDIEKGGNNWISNQTYNTCDTYNIVRDEKFKQLNITLGRYRSSVFCSNPGSLVSGINDLGVFLALSIAA